MSTSGVLNSIYLGAARGRVCMRLGRIRFSAKRSKSPRKLPRSFLSRQTGGLAGRLQFWMEGARGAVLGESWRARQGFFFNS